VLTAAQLRQAAAQGLADQRQGERQGGKEGVEDEKRTQNVFRRLAQPEKDRQAAEAKQARDKRAADAERLDDLRLQNRLIKAKDNGAKIAILQQQLAKTTDPIERQQLQNQIDQERLSTAGRVNTAADKRLATEERTYDAIQKQRDALLDIEELEIKDRQSDRSAAEKVRIANALINGLGGRTDARANQIRGGAQDTIALASVEDRRRAFELERARATAGGAITAQGRLLQSQAGGTPAAGGSPSASAAGASAPARAGATTIVLQLVDGGRVLAQTVEPFVMEALMQGINAVKVSKGA
jgi:hypothetical protein